MQTFSIRPDGSENPLYDLPGFPVRTGEGLLSDFAGYAAGCHWHRDFEILMAVDGEMDCFVNGETVHLLPGEAVFVNSGRLHYGFSLSQQDCRYRFAVFSPDALGQAAPVAERMEQLASRRDWVVLHPADAQERGILDSLSWLVADRAKDVLETLSALARMARGLCSLLPPAETEADWSVLRQMIGYIQSHYQETVRLSDIAGAGAVCRSRCCDLFREHLKRTPIEYVTLYRLSKACDALRIGKTATEAALLSGFSTPSYFAECFRRFYGETPSRYRSRLLKG